MKSTRNARRLALAAMVMGLSMASTAHAQTEPFPQWAFPPSNLQKPAEGWDKIKPLTLPGAKRTFTEDAVRDRYVAPDWFPDKHPPAPAGVLNARKDAVAACGYCHLPDGSGRPENAGVSGLPADYIRRQVVAFRAGTRKSAAPGYVPTDLMSQVAAQVTDQELAAAARYFAAIPAKRHVRVVEAARIRGSEAKGFLLRAVPGAGEALGDRIVEGPQDFGSEGVGSDDFERFERRDPRLVYIAYVPPGALKRGQDLARTGGGGLTVACNTCHGTGLRAGVGAAGPPLAGRSPSYIFRQLYGFSIGARGGDASAPMQAVVARLTQRDMIALAAYAGSLKP